jgi:hypothetical protein
MTDLEVKLDRFETLAAECESIAKLATDGAKREYICVSPYIIAS